ncbi:MAG: carbohydrate ABC transporter permease [Caldilineaceae bacterium]|nr:carbohydrate ABC transporter permease [Caldilineaceae bacterium]
MAQETLVRTATQTYPVSSRARSRKQQRVMGRALLYFIAIAASLLFMLPFAWTVFSSLKSPSELYQSPPSWFPETARFVNYAEVFQVAPYGRWLLNSAFVSIVGTFGAVFSAALTGYSFARFRYPGRNLIFMLTLSTMMLPAEVTLIPLYLLFNKIRWLDTYLPLIVPSFFGGGAFLIFMMRQFFMTIPMDLDEAARIDGAGYLRIFAQILLPLCVPALATAAIITFIADWNSFLFPYIILNTKEKFVIGIGIKYFQTVASNIDSMEPRENLLMAASIMMTAPIIFLFFTAQRYFVRGIVMSGIKG